MVDGPLHETVLEIEPVYPTLDKLLRAQAVAAAYAAGRVRFPLGRNGEPPPPWVAKVIAVLRAFTGVKDPHDDDVDALAHLWNGLFRSGGNVALGVPIVIGPGVDAQTEEEEAAHGRAA